MEEELHTTEVLTGKGKEGNEGGESQGVKGPRDNKEKKESARQTTSANTTPKARGRPTKAVAQIKERERAISEGRLREYLEKKRKGQEVECSEEVKEERKHMLKRSQKTRRAPTKEELKEEDKEKNRTEGGEEKGIDTGDEEKKEEDRMEEKSDREVLLRICEELREMKTEAAKNRVEEKKEREEEMETLKKEIKRIEDKREQEVKEIKEKMETVKTVFKETVQMLEEKIKNLEREVGDRRVEEAVGEGKKEEVTSWMRTLEKKIEERREVNKVVEEKRLSDIEDKLEARERLDRRNNIIIKGLELERGGEARGKVKEFLRMQFGVKEEAIEGVKVVGRETRMIWVRIRSREEKEEIMSKKSRLGKEIYIENDLTWKERVLQRKIGGIARGGKSKREKSESGIQGNDSRREEIRME
ncbi:PREDICTED: trichohyalin-like [Vollenhovia emeryi]|uniref:trichohyalin-like n=1 Tax=Vollenhovia emeryi TaxID=411798 RepID=UPI0005F5618F|nr:PREDICTED: trichohyalin-like [Vollenhovia emeryi]